MEAGNFIVRFALDYMGGNDQISTLTRLQGSSILDRMLY